MNIDHWYGERPLNIAHRGASGHAPANTLSAFVLAADMGADGIELDVHLSSDGEVVVIHDGTVDATTDGRGRVSEMPLRALQGLDAGSWFGPQFAGERIPLLSEVFEHVGRRLLVNVEIKASPGYHPPALEAEVVRLIEDCGMLERVIVSSFSLRSLRRVRSLNPHIPLGWLHSTPVPTLLLAALRALRFDMAALHPRHNDVGAQYVARAQRWGKRVHVWTVNDARSMAQMRDLGVDGIITNYPDVLRDVLSGR
ncbi:MAG: glycerophosphodiester phosphodiesterase [Anaerolineae bacterium]|nr:glycerophosphodiester phosphodiesterase [Anaerolineae bacterium]